MEKIFEMLESIYEKENLIVAFATMFGMTGSNGEIPHTKLPQNIIKNVWVVLTRDVFTVYGRKPTIRAIESRYGLIPSSPFLIEMMSHSESFDGSDKGGKGGEDIQYHLENLNTESGLALREEILDAASPEARAFFDDCNYEPMVIADGADLTEDEWHERRKTCIGASEVAAVMGTSPFTNNVTLWHQKMGDEVVVEDPEEETFHKELIFLWGHIAEEYLRAKILDKTQFPQFEGCEVLVDTKIYSNEKFPFLTANLDAILKWPDGHYSVLEFKAPSIHTKEKYQDNAIPEYYAEQMQEQMFLTNIDDAYLCVLFGRDEVSVSHLVRDLDEQMELVQSCSEFWHGSVLAQLEPEANGSGELLIETARRYKGKGDKNAPPKTLDPSVLANMLEKADKIYQQKAALNQQIKMLDKELKEALAPALYEMGQSELAVCRDDAHNCLYRVTYKETPGAPKLNKANMERLQVENPQLYAALAPYITYSNGYRTAKIRKEIV